MSDEIVQAAKRLVAHWGRRPERSIAYTEAGERAKAMLTHAVRDHDERARLAALSAPSEPVQDQPRVLGYVVLTEGADGRWHDDWDAQVHVDVAAGRQALARCRFEGYESALTELHEVVEEAVDGPA